MGKLSARLFRFGCIVLFCFGAIHTLGLAKSPQQMGLKEFIQIALVNSPAITQGDLQLEDARLQHEAAVGSTGLQIQFNLELDRMHQKTDSLLQNLPGDDFWQGGASLEAVTQAPLGLEVGLVAGWNDAHIVGTEYAFQPFFEERYSLGIHVSRPLFRSTESLLAYQRVQATEHTLYYQKIQQISLTHQVLLESAQAFFSLWRSQQVIASLAKRITWATTQIDLLQAQVEAGVAHKLDLQEAQLWKTELTVQQRIAEQGLKLQLETITHTLSIPVSVILEVDHQVLQALSVQELVVIPEESLDLALARLAYNTSLQFLKKTQDEAGLQGEIHGMVNSDRNWSVSVLVQYPLFDSGVRTSQIQSAQAQLEKAQSQLDRAIFTERQRQIEINQRVTNAKNRLDMAKENRLLAQGRWKIVQERDKLGAVSFGERYTGIDQIEVAYLRLIDAYIEYYLDRIKQQLFHN